MMGGAKRDLSENLRRMGFAHLEKSKVNYHGLKPVVSVGPVKQICLRFAPGGHSSPGLKARGFLADYLKRKNRASPAY
jgi:hypothetical protein